jgi:hypothetical protein
MNEVAENSTQKCSGAGPAIDTLLMLKLPDEGAELSI